MCKGCLLYTRLLKAVSRLPKNTMGMMTRRMMIADRGVNIIWRKHPSTCMLCQAFRFGL